jgi:hypothetical protein
MDLPSDFVHPVSPRLPVNYWNARIRAASVAQSLNPDGPFEINLFNYSEKSKGVYHRVNSICSSAMIVSME